MTTNRYLETRRVTLVSIILNIVLAIVKIVFGYVGRSQALFADGIHSLTDLITDALVIIAAKFGSEKPDAEHPYGHGRIETIINVVIAIIIGIVGIGIVWDAAYVALSAEKTPIPGTATVITALFAVISKEWIYHYTIAASKRIHSNILRANAWHNRADAFTSLIVLIGIIGAIIGVHVLDAIAAVIVGILIMKTSFDITWQSIRELIDTAADEDTVERIRKQILTVNGVHSIHQLRTRMMSGSIFVDVHILVNPKISVSEGHHISDHVMKTLIDGFKRVADVVVHVDPEDDEVVPTSVHLPTREALLSELKPLWENLPAYDQIDHIHLHYLSGEIHIEITFPLSILDNLNMTAETLSKLYKQATLTLKHISTLKVNFA